MAISDKKKCQTLINRCAEAAEQIQAAGSLLNSLRTAYTAQSVDPTGTPLEGKVALVSTWIDSVIAAGQNATANQMIAAKVPGHKNNALRV